VRLPRSFYRRDTLAVARDLLGRTLCRRRGGGEVLRGRIVEVEAYDGPDDRASHAHRGRTARNAAMFEAGGIAYVYQIYGMHFCLNVVTGGAGYPAAVLLRACEGPVDDLSASGPGRLCRAFGIDRSLDGCALVGPELWIEAGQPVADAAVRRTPRIGVHYAGEWVRRPYRLVLRGHAAVSGPRRMR
jgi:DNA-3-methyladenine glycosylase